MSFGQPVTRQTSVSRGLQELASKFSVLAFELNGKGGGEDDSEVVCPLSGKESQFDALGDIPMDK